MTPHHDTQYARGRRTRAQWRRPAATATATNEGTRDEQPLAAVSVSEINAELLRARRRVRPETWRRGQLVLMFIAVIVSVIALIIQFRGQSIDPVEQAPPEVISTPSAGDATASALIPD